MARFIAFLAAGLFLYAESAMAELCDNPKTQADMNYCAKYASERADSELNDIYGRLRDGYAKFPASKTALVKSQRAWLVFRDAECKQDEVAAGGGSATPMVVLNCLARVTSARANQLQDRLLCKEGEMSCVPTGNAAD